jgi:hypothetical protein
MELTRSMFNKEQYDYLSVEDSKRYDELKDSNNPLEQEIVQMIMKKAESSRASHCSCSR